MAITTGAIRLAERHLSRDAIMAKLVQKHGPCTLGRKRRDPFHTLCVSIISQQLSSKAADTIASRVEALIGSSGRMTHKHFKAVTIEQLRGCGLSNSKAKWLTSIADAARTGDLSFSKIAKMTDAEAIKTLDALPGIGQWTAEMFLIFALNRPDIFSMGDVGLRRAVNTLYNGGRKLSDRRTHELAERWSPYRSVACWYLWRSSDAPD
ncbi:MAG TPA: DNA-3-methyladenine glycosylase [Nevskiaceae bacterium]|nr:DNA-3-methyladenine glycosylase [Nevskiaceae bacterium]